MKLSEKELSKFGYDHPINKAIRKAADDAAAKHQSVKSSQSEEIESQDTDDDDVEQTIPSNPNQARYNPNGDGWANNDFIVNLIVSPLFILFGIKVLMVLILVIAVLGEAAC